MAVMFFFPCAVECLELSAASVSESVSSSEYLATNLVHVGEYLVSRPSGRVPRVEVIPLRSCVHHEVDGRASTENTASWYNGFSACKLLGLVAFVEKRGLCGRKEILQVECRVHDTGNILVV